MKRKRVKPSIRRIHVHNIFLKLRDVFKKHNRLFEKDGGFFVKTCLCGYLCLLFNHPSYHYPCINYFAVFLNRFGKIKAIK